VLEIQENSVGQTHPSTNSLDQDSGKFHLKKMGPVSLKNVGDPVEVWEAKPDRRTAPH